MKDLWSKFTATLPMPFAGALLVAMAFWGFIAWDQSHWWAAKDDYGFGWLVPAFVAFVIYDRWPKIAKAAAACVAPDSPRVGGAKSGLLNTLAYGSLGVGGLMFLAGAFQRAGAGASYPGTLTITLGAAAVLLPWLFLNAPETSRPVPGAKFGDDARVRLVACFLFPVLVWLVSAPMVTAVENTLSLFLLMKVTKVVFFTFDLLGLQIEQQGNVLVLPKGNVGVAEACSGIRSLTACLFAGSFLASVFLDKLWKKIALVAMAMMFAVLTNLVRSLFLTAWAYNYGPEAIEGKVHDTAGYAVLGLTVIGLLCLLPLFNLNITFSGSDTALEPEEADEAGEDAPPVDPKS
jgi:exosortase/archaeosortase family protein